MSKHLYLTSLNFFNDHPICKIMLLFFASFCPIITFVSYGALLMILLIHKDPWIIQAIAIPAGCFMTTTILRKFRNAPRPFEVYQLTPLKPHDPGESFPSRHSASALIIALTVLQFQLVWGIILLLDALMIGFIRIAMAVHFPKDVLAGFLLAAIFDLLFYL